jgi:hypothetical protein
MVAEGEAVEAEEEAEAEDETDALAASGLFVDVGALEVGEGLEEDVELAFASWRRIRGNDWTACTAASSVNIFVTCIVGEWALSKAINACRERKGALGTGVGTCVKERRCGTDKA